MCYTYVEAAVINLHHQAGDAIALVAVVSIVAATEGDTDGVQKRLAALGAVDLSSSS